MINVTPVRTIVLTMAVLCGIAVTARSQPQPVPRLAVRQLDKPSYVELARQWREYIDKHGESADALVNLARAYDYSEEEDAAVAALGRAVELDPDHPEALAYYGMLMATFLGDPEGALPLLRHCRDVAPGYEYGLTGLATLYMRTGDLKLADEVFKTIFDQRVIPVPLQDYAYNMLVGLPEGAVLFTNGDNDTYPPLALQAGMGFRTDVAVINMSMLSVAVYDDALFDRYPAIRPRGEVDPDGEKVLHQELIRRIVEEKKAPVYFASTVDFGFAGLEPDLHLEGLNLRAGKKGISGEESAALFFDAYRMDSADGWSFPWSLYPAISKQMSNYVTAMFKVAEMDGVTDATRERLLGRALRLSEFHDFERLTIYIRQAMKKK
jgi:hypothetical protein